MWSNSPKENLKIMEENTIKMCNEIKEGKVNLDTVEIQVGSAIVDEGIVIYKKKLANKEDVFSKMFLDSFLLDIYYKNKLEYKCLVSKKENGVLIVIQIMEIDAGVTGVYYDDDGSIAPFLTEKVKRVVARTGSGIITPEEYSHNLILEFLAIVGYINGIATSEKEVITKTTVVKPTSSNPKKKKKKGAKKQKVKLTKKYVINTNMIDKSDNKTLAKRGYIKRNFCFQVGGHWRYYRNKETGEVVKKVWVNSYTKGKDKGEKQTKTYTL